MVEESMGWRSVEWNQQGGQGTQEAAAPKKKNKKNCAPEMAAHVEIGRNDVGWSRRPQNRSVSLFPSIWLIRIQKSEQGRCDASTVPFFTFPLGQFLSFPYIKSCWLDFRRAFSPYIYCVWLRITVCVCVCACTYTYSSQREKQCANRSVQWNI